MKTTLFPRAFRLLPKTMAALVFATLALASAQSAHAALLISNDGQEVSDSVTGLIWQRCAAGKSWDGTTCSGRGQSYQLPAAFSIARNEAESTGKAWRLPNIKELQSIVVHQQAPMIDRGAFPATPVAAFWSSTPWIFNPRGGYVEDFAIGKTGNLASTDYANLRLVRGGR